MPRASDRVTDIYLWMISAGLLCLSVGLALGPPPSELVPFSLPPGQVLHFLMYSLTVLSLLLVAVWRPGRGTGRFPRSGPLLIVLAIVAGLALELVQGLFLIERDANIGDALANAAGAFLAAWIWSRLKRQASRA